MGEHGDEFVEIAKDPTKLALVLNSYDRRLASIEKDVGKIAKSAFWVIGSVMMMVITTILVKTGVIVP